MNDSQNDDLDSKLEALFRREHAHLPSEPFSSATLRVVAAERRRTALRARLMRATGLVALIFLSPLLIDASVWISAWLDAALAFASGWLASPVGLGAAALCALAALATKWARVW